MFMRAFISALFLLALALPSRALNHLFIYPLDEFASAPDRDHLRIGYAHMNETSDFDDSSGLNFMGGKTFGRHLHAWGSGYTNRSFESYVVDYNGGETRSISTQFYSFLSAGIGAFAEPINRLQLYARAGYSFCYIRAAGNSLLSGYKRINVNSTVSDGYALLLGGSVFATPDLVLSANVSRSAFNENEYLPFFAINRFHAEASYRILKDLKASAGILMSELQNANWTTPHARLEYRFSEPAAAYVEASQINFEGDYDSQVGFTGGVRFFLR